MTQDQGDDWRKGLFHPLTGKARNNTPIYAFDCETEHVRHDFSRKNHRTVKCYRQDFVMGSVVGKDFQKVFWDRQEMADFLLSRKMRDCMIFAHNLEFDFNQLYHDRISEFHLISRQHLIAALKYQEEDRHDEGHKKNRRKWQLIDTLNYANFSLEKIGNKIVKEAKLPHPKVMEKTNGAEQLLARRPRNTEEEEELVRYNLQDSRITYLFAEKYRQFCDSMNCKMRLTTPSTGMDYWRRNFMKVPMKKEPEQLVRKHFLGSFRGGITNVYKRGCYDGKMWYYDYNSSYPARMVEGVDGKGNYPFPGSHGHKEKATDGIIEEYDGICFAKIKAPYSYFPILSVHAGKMLNPYGTFSGWFTNHELRLAQKEGYEIEYGECIYYYETFKPFREAVQTLYKLRQQYKLEGSPFEELVKLFMNGGLFGKWGTNFMKMEEIIAEDLVTFDKEGRAYFKDQELTKYNPGSGLIVMNKEMDSPAYSFPILSEYTTMLGRIKLWQDCKDHFDALAMNDTDSALMTKPCFESSKELGAFKLEAVVDKGITVRPKMYAKHRTEEYLEGENDDGWDTKSKGVGRFLKGHQKFVDGIRKGSVEMSRFTRMRESFKCGIKPGSVIVFDKKVTTDDDKRDWKGKAFSLDDWQDSDPLFLKDGYLKSELDKLQRKSYEAYRKQQEQERKTFINSDLFDRHAVGSDISYEEFLENEMLAGRE